MDPNALLALAAFAAAMTFSPGPNNVMLVASGANFGFRRTLPHMAGIGLGVAAMVAAAAFGVAAAVAAEPRVALGLRVAGAAAVLWLAWRIATADAAGDASARGRPLTLFEAAAFQWVNPKAWAMSLTAASVYAPAPGWAGALAMAAVFAAVAAPSTSLWTAAGGALRAWLSPPGRRRAFNLGMAALLLASMAPVLLG